MMAETFTEREVQEAMFAVDRFCQIYWPTAGEGDKHKLAFAFLKFARDYEAYKRTWTT